jgi:hypothetical protein
MTKDNVEPVAWMRNDGKRVTTAAYRHNYPDYETRYSIPLYTTPPAAQRPWVGLTESEVDECYESVMFNADIEATRFLVYQAIEAKLREKTT